MAKEQVEFMDGFDRLNWLMEHADEKEVSEFFNPGKEKGADLVVQDSSSDVSPAPTGKLEEAIPAKLNGSRRESSSRRRDLKGSKPAVTDGMDQTGSIYYRLPKRKRSLLRFVALYRGKSMNACIDEAMDPYFASFMKEFRKKHGANEQTVQMIIDMLGND